MSETERFVDQDENPIPPQSTWETLTVNQLIDIKSKLYDKAFAFRNTPQILMVLNKSIETITKLISKQSS